MYQKIDCINNDELNQMLTLFVIPRNQRVLSQNILQNS